MAKWRSKRGKTGHRVSKTEREIRTYLDSTGLPYDIVAGSRHMHIVLNGRRIGVFDATSDGHGPRGLLNLRMQIKRSAREFSASV